MKGYFLLGSLLALILLTACGPTVTAPAPVPESAIFTQAAQTFVAELTVTAAAATETPPASPTPFLATETTVATETAAPTATQPPTDTPSPTDTPVPSVTATEVPNTIFEEDFEDETGWFTEDNDDFTFEFNEGGYLVTNRLTNAAIWSIREVDEADVRIEVDAMRTGGPESGMYGLLCRQEDDDNYYALLVSANGAFAIAKMEDGELETLQEGTAPEGLMRGEGKMDRIRADCVGETLTLYVNGQQLGQVEDDDLNGGPVGLVSKTNPEANLEVLFDNFAIILP